MYDYSSEDVDDLVLKVGDLIIVHPDQPHEPGWLGGELDGKVGWFPEAYAEPVSKHQKIYKSPGRPKKTREIRY